MKRGFFVLVGMVILFAMMPVHAQLMVDEENYVAVGQGIKFSDGSTQTIAYDRTAPVGETGQTTCYDPTGNTADTVPCGGTGQDGHLRPGVGWPNPRFTDNSDGTVTDNLTKLVWLKDADCFGTRDWETALADCNGLSNGTCGLSDGSIAGQWRLPSRFELESLLNLEYSSPALSNASGAAKWTEGDAFTGVQSGYYWSSGTYVGSAGYAWYVYMSDGHVNAFIKTNDNYVWPVRDDN